MNSFYLENPALFKLLVNFSPLLFCLFYAKFKTIKTAISIGVISIGFFLVGFQISEDIRRLLALNIVLNPIISFFISNFLKFYTMKNIKTYTVNQFIKSENVATGLITNFVLDYPSSITWVTGGGGKYGSKQFHHMTPIYSKGNNKVVCWSETKNIANNIFTNNLTSIYMDKVKAHISFKKHIPNQDWAPVVTLFHDIQRLLKLNFILASGVLLLSLLRMLL